MKINNYILGISDSHESGICLIKNNKVLFAINEERISRLKNDQSFPEKSIMLALEKLKIKAQDINTVCVAGISRESDNIPTNNNLTDSFNKIPLQISIIGKLSNYLIFKKFFKSIFFFYLLKIFFRIKLIKRKFLIKKKLKNLNIDSKNIFFFDHHLCHIFSAFASSKFNNSLIISNDGMGDGLCNRVLFIKRNKLTFLSKNSFYNSLAMIYGYCSYLCGFKKNHHNGKTTGISAMGNGREVFEILNKIIKWNKKKGIYENKEGVFTSSFDKIKNLVKKFNKFEIANGIQNLTDSIIIKQTGYFLKKLNTNNLCYV
jgi:carbamoyltransferase